MGKTFIALLLAIAFIVFEAKSPKRGIAYNLATEGDIGAVSSGVSWWYNWALRKHDGVPGNYRERFGMEFIPMLWDANFNEDDAVNHINSLGVGYFLVLNEPNLVEQANLNPGHAASIWPKYERVAERTGAKIVGPQITWGTMQGFQDPVVWIDNFLGSYRYASSRR